MPTYVAAILGLIAALTCTILMFVLVMPESKRESLPKFFKVMHDFFNFKVLFLEYILKGLHLFTTLFMIGYGFFLLFASSSSYQFQSTALTGLLYMIIGPIVSRVVYEFMTMFIVLVRNTNQINKKMPKDKD